MDTGDIALIVAGVLGTIGIVGAAFMLDRRSQRIKSEKGWRAWALLTRLRRELMERLQGPLRLQDHRGEPKPAKRKRKAATPRRKRSRKPAR